MIAYMQHKMNPKISVIIPVFNPGRGIKRCIDSLRAQTLKEIEMIFVDDLGTDDSMEKVRASAAEDSRIQIVKNVENIGAGPSRNRGIELARGEYLSFVDPDDYLAEDFLEILYAKAKSASFDIVKGTIVRIKEDGTVFPVEIKLNEIIRRRLSEGKALYRYFTYEHQSAIYRRDFLLSNNILYGVSRRAQDNTFLLKASFKAKDVALIDDAQYFFCERRDSAMHTADSRHIQGYLQAVSEQLKYITTTIPKDKGLMQFLQGFFLNALKEGWRYDCLYDMKKESAAFMSGLQNELTCLPYCDELSEKNYSLEALRDYGACLPKTPFTSPWEGKQSPVRYAKLAESWTDYYLRHPKEADYCGKDILEIYSKAFHAVSDRTTTYYSTEEKREGKMLLKKQLKRLPRPLRTSICISSIAQKF